MTDTETMQQAAAVGRRALLKGVAAGAFALGSGAAGMANADAKPRSKAGPDHFEASDRGAIVQIEPGRLRGYVHDGIFTFKGIPYGDDTGGARRFLPPRKPAAWDGVRSAMAYGPVSPQPPRDGWRHDEEAWMFAWNDGVPGEDCLRLNVWTRSLDQTAKRPVMVWLHGGGFTSGCGQEQPGYDGENLARNGDVVLVSLNHRLGPLGFLDVSHFGPEYRDSGNAGMLDIVLALEWVRDNIAAFGGDPGCVTIFGQSGGGGKVSTLMTMPRAQGLFHRAVIQSGSTLLLGTSGASAKLGGQLCGELGEAGKSIEGMRAVAPAALVAAGLSLQAKLRPPGTVFVVGRAPREGDFGPHVDGDHIPRHPFENDAPPLSRAVPLLVGSVLNEQVHALNHPEYETMSEADARAAVAKVYGTHSEAIYAAVKRRRPELKPFDVYSQAVAGSARARALRQAKLKTAQATAPGGAPAYVYWFTWQTPVLDGRPRAYHCSEIAFAFDNAVVLAGTMTGGGERAARLSRQVSQAWINFARHGNPAHPGLGKWPAYSADDSVTMVLDDQCRVERAPDREEQALIAVAFGIES